MPYCFHADSFIPFSFSVVFLFKMIAKELQTCHKSKNQNKYLHLPTEVHVLKDNKKEKK